MLDKAEYSAFQYTLNSALISASCFTALTETTFGPKPEVALLVYCVAVRSAILATAWLLVFNFKIFRNVPFADVSGGDFGERPRQAADAWQAANTGVQLTVPVRSKCACAAQEFLAAKTDRIKRVQQGVRDTTMLLGIFLEQNAVDSDVLSGIGV